MYGIFQYKNTHCPICIDYNIVNTKYTFSYIHCIYVYHYITISVLLRCIMYNNYCNVTSTQPCEAFLRENKLSERV